MTTHLVTFSDESMSRSAQLCIESAEANGVTSHSYYNPGNIMHCANMREYWPAMDRMFSHARGCGYWFWKPLIIKTSMDIVNDGDIIIYADAGVEFIAPVSHIINRMDQDIFLFGNNWEHAHWCKRTWLMLFTVTMRSRGNYYHRGLISGNSVRHQSFSFEYQITHGHL